MSQTLVVFQIINVTEARIIFLNKDLNKVDLAQTS